VNIVEDGYYSLACNSIIDTYGYVYKDNFIPSNPLINTIAEDDDSGCNNQFKLITYLETNTTYILVVTAYRVNVTGPFSIIASGSNNVTLKHISEYIYYLLHNEHRKA
jgi:hypothetical protein